MNVSVDGPRMTVNRKSLWDSAPARRPMAGCSPGFLLCHLLPVGVAARDKGAGNLSGGEALIFFRMKEMLIGNTNQSHR